ncbi:MAG: hypothetical protein C0404_04265 [Verrucomicrobia bacterium]|nr:hypothetical protein [Verrucomicrobiota bacterium]
MKKWKAIAGVLVVFLLGVAAGGLATGLTIRKQAQRFARSGLEARAEWIVGRLDSRLGLDDAQRERVRMIVREGQEDLAPIRRQMADAFARSEARIRDVLTPEQAAKYDKLIADRKAERGQVP